MTRTPLSVYRDQGGAHSFMSPSKEGFPVRTQRDLPEETRYRGVISRIKFIFFSGVQGVFSLIPRQNFTLPMVPDPEYPHGDGPWMLHKITVAIRGY